MDIFKAFWIKLIDHVFMRKLYKYVLYIILCPERLLHEVAGRIIRLERALLVCDDSLSRNGMTLVELSCSAVRCEGKVDRQVQWPHFFTHFPLSHFAVQTQHSCSLYLYLLKKILFWVVVLFILCNCTVCMCTVVILIVIH